MTVFETMQEEEIKMLTPLFLTLYKPLDSSQRGSTVLEA